MPRDRLVPLRADLPEDSDFPVFTCNDCAGEGREGVESVIAQEHEGAKHRYYGLCGNHAEVSNLTEAWSEVYQ